MFESQQKEKLDVGKLEVSKLGVTQLEVGEPYKTCTCIQKKRTSQSERARECYIFGRGGEWIKNTCPVW